MKAERGTKRTCQSCNAKFYDLNRAEFDCPKCGDPFQLENKVEEVVVEVEEEEKLAVTPVDEVVDGGDVEALTEEDDLESLDDVDDNEENQDDDTLLATDDDENDDVSGLIGDIPSDDEEG